MKMDERIGRHGQWQIYVRDPQGEVGKWRTCWPRKLPGEVCICDSHLAATHKFGNHPGT
jgi:hypothetical protein